QVHGGDLAGAIQTQNRGVELSVLLTLPAAIGLAILAHPILAVLFQRGAFGPEATSATAAALSAYALGLPAFVLVKVLAPAFFARQNTRTPVKIAVAAMAVNLGLTLLLMRPLAHVGVAIALSVAGWMQALALMILLSRRGQFRFDDRARANLPRIAAAAVAMGAALIALRLALAPALAGAAILRLGALFALIAAGVIIFAGLILALGVAGWRDLRRLDPAPQRR